jgi:putative ABC transport system permease protein
MLLSPLYVATPELLARYGVTSDPGVEFLTTQSGEIGILGTATARASAIRDIPRVTDAVHLTQGYTSVPGSFVTPEALAARGWVAVPAGEWFVDTPTALTADDLRHARDVAAGLGLEIESRDQQHGLVTLRRTATIAGMALALGLLAMTVGLVRGESATDLRTLTATGASRRIRRTLTAATAAGLALAGAALGTVAAGVVMLAAFHDLDALRPVPIAQLVAIGLGTPLLAALGGFLAGGREPGAIARQPIG